MIYMFALMKLHPLVGWPIARRSAIQPFIAIERECSSRAVRTFHCALRALAPHHPWSFPLFSVGR